MTFSVGFRTLFGKEVRRFLRVPGQTLASPLVTTVLYFVVFGYTLGGQLQAVQGVSYARFITPGLVMLGVVMNAYLNASSSMFVQKIQGTIVDLLVAPLSYMEVLSAFVLGAAARGLVVGTATWLVAGAFTGFEVAHPLWALAFLVSVSVLFGAAGLATGIWAEKFEQVNLVPTFVVTPLTFLGGVFYAVDRLPASLQPIARLNPVLYMVDGLRYGLVGVSDTDPAVGLALVLSLVAGLVFLAHRWLVTGYKLRS